jgi:toxin ParE1/3/4
VVRAALPRPRSRLSEGDACFERIRRSADSFQQIYKTARRARIRRFPYLVYFVATPAGIQIVACMHAKRDPRIWQRRVDR